MINELAILSESMKESGITPEQWHSKYLPIPNIKTNSPCVRIILSKGKIFRLEPVTAETGKQIRKFGSNQSSFPAMNLKPLYRITDPTQKKSLDRALKGKTIITPSQARAWCIEPYWGQKFRKKFDLCMKKSPAEIYQILRGSSFEEEFNILMHETEAIADADLLHKAMEDAAFDLLERKENTSLALRILFYSGNAEKDIQEDDSGALSVVFDCSELINREIPVISGGFTRKLNRALLNRQEDDKKVQPAALTDAFGTCFRPFEETMPKIKLAGGFDTTLRTMFKEQICQERYDRFEGDSYPIAREKRLELAAALEWIGNEDNRNVTWYRTGAKYKTGPQEILFVYPERLPEIDQSTSFLGIFTELEAYREEEFAALSRAFISSISGKHDSGAESRPDLVHIFILRKIDKARTRVLYSRETNPYELDQRAGCWDAGKNNLPSLIIGKPKTLLLLDAAEVMNRAWKQDGTEISGFRQVPIYHGIEMFFGVPNHAERDLSMLIRATEPAAPELVKLIIKGEVREAAEDDVRSGERKQSKKHSSGLFIYMIRQAAMLMGFLLLELNCRKEYYMQEFAYLYGQMLKISDELHLLYCNVVRNGDIPPQLVGGSLYMSVSEAPIRAMGILSERMIPYINWAKSFQAKNGQENKDEKRRAGWLMKLYSENAGQIRDALDRYHGGRFTDTEKTQFFLGYLSAFPRRDDLKQRLTDNGGKEND